LSRVQLSIEYLDVSSSLYL